VAVRAGLFLANNTPASDAKLMEPVKSKETYVTEK
jgi:hypothetical protein